ncbi:uncharacterized protein LOC121728459 [Aricia agestis]|uniref:uncharacterized protein LOC121728459 n=1 Tax=Aricia agestis TaxID=91739 RepID=UPI001C206F0C|nr:uncharacterized protein LOC121728459 [Aricia agestis]
METVPYHPLIEISQEQLKQAREFYGVGNAKRIQESLDQVEEWCKKQDHLVDALPFLSRIILERLFIMAKGSIEGTKIKIDKFCTTRAMMPEICLNKTLEEFDQLSKSVSYVPLPKLNPADNSRVMVTQLTSENFDNISLLSYIRYCYFIGEYRLNFDYSISERYIVDLKHANSSLLTKLNPIILKKGEILCTEGYGTKIAGIHILNAPSFVDKFVFILKQGLKEKVASRLHVHNSYEDLQKHISKEILPKDYDGLAPPMSELREQWQETLKSEETRRLVQNAERLVSNESKRSVAKFNEEYLGMPGSFRKLNVD